MSKLPNLPYKQLDKNNKDRSVCMNLADQLRVLSKITINLLVKKEFIRANKDLDKMAEIFKTLKKNVANNPYLYSVAAIDAGIEEYLEAIFLLSYLNNKTLPSISALGVAPEVYLGGLSDMTGELVRLARYNAKDAQSIHDYVSQIYELTIPISITRNSGLRTKLETIGGNLNKLEGILYDLRLRDKI